MQFKERLLRIRLHGHGIGDLADWVDGVERVFRLWKDGPFRVFNDRHHIGVSLKMQNEDQIIRNCCKSQKRIQSLKNESLATLSLTLKIAHCLIAEIFGD